MESTYSETVEYFDVATPDASTLKSVISLVAREESISLQGSPERDDAVCVDQYQGGQSSSSAVVTDGDSHVDVLDISGSATSTTEPSAAATPSTDKSTSSASSGARQQTLLELLMSGGCCLALFPILQLQLLLVARFPNDVSTISSLTPAQPSSVSPSTSTTPHDFASVRVEFLMLCRLAWSIAVNQAVEAPLVKAAMGLPDASTRGWTRALCRLLYLFFMPVRVMCRALLMPLCVAMLAPGQQTQVS